MTPTIGDTVNVIVNPAVNGGSDTATAEITHVHGQAGPRWTVDYELPIGDRTHLVTNATLHPDEEAARRSRNVDGLAAFRPVEG